tara:strand:+ start:333 stop:848 length:516 start_codon:yes stop_codon:yes gene_type:complete
MSSVNGNKYDRGSPSSSSYLRTTASLSGNTHGRDTLSSSSNSSSSSSSSSSSNDHQLRYTKKHKKEVFFYHEWHPWFVGWNMKIMADEIASGNKNGLNIFNTVFKRDLKVSEGFNGRWIDLFEQLQKQGRKCESKTLILLIARRCDFLTSEKVIAKIMMSHYDSKKTFALF